jgi:hypothetical protein
MRAVYFHLFVSHSCQQPLCVFFSGVARSAIFFVGMLGLAALIGCSQKTSEGAHQKDFEQALKNAIASRNDWIDIASLVNFKWEKICVMFPYGTVLDDKAVPSSFDAFKEMPWATSESYWSIVFIDKQHKVIPLKVHRTNVAGFDDQVNRSGQCVEKADARLLLVKNGKPRLRLISK